MMLSFQIARISIACDRRQPPATTWIGAIAFVMARIPRYVQAGYRLPSLLRRDRR
jgi:hypothetical protein